jgi:hypothetical protein
VFELLKKNYTEINRRQLGLTVTVGYKLDNFPFSFSLSEKVVVNLIARVEPLGRSRVEPERVKVGSGQLQ